jgi:hypothetical protein
MQGPGAFESSTPRGDLDEIPFKLLNYKKIHISVSISFGAKIKAYGKLVWFIVCIWLMGCLSIPKFEQNKAIWRLQLSLEQGSVTGGQIFRQLT